MHSCRCPEITLGERCHARHESLERCVRKAYPGEAGDKLQHRAGCVCLPILRFPLPQSAETATAGTQIKQWFRKNPNVDVRIPMWLHLTRRCLTPSQQAHYAPTGSRYPCVMLYASCEQNTAVRNRVRKHCVPPKNRPGPNQRGFQAPRARLLQL